MTFTLRSPMSKRFFERDLQSERSKNGKAGEDVLQGYNDVCAWHKVAIVYRIATPMQILNCSDTLKKMIEKELGKGVFPSVHSGKQGPDYVGYMLDTTSRYIAIECKHLADDTKPFRMSAVTEHQRGRLERASHSRGTAIALLAIVHGPLKKLTVFEWREVKDKVSISPQELLDNVAIIGEPYLKKYYQGAV